MAGLTAAIAAASAAASKLFFLAQRLGEIQRHAQQKDDWNHSECGDHGDVRVTVSREAN
jgi:hypothetical protein